MSGTVADLWLRAFLKRKGWTIRELSRRSGVHESTLSKIGRGVYELSDKNKRKIQEAK
jgi:lambda repressor-like predicted transcriptional regulator